MARRPRTPKSRSLRSQGVENTAPQLRFRLGELDIVARDGDTLAIVEVRKRSSAKFGGCQRASVDFRKQIKLGVQRMYVFSTW